MMSKSGIVKSVAFCVFLGGMSGLQAKDPSVGFAQEVLNTHHSKNFNFWDGGLQQPDGGMVVRSKFDVNGDGVDDWLYKSTLETDESQGWSVYLNTERSTTQLADPLLLAGATYVKTEEGETVFTSIYKRQDWLGITRAYVSPKGNIRIEKEPPVEGFDKVSKIVSQKGWPQSDYGKILETKNEEVTSLQSILNGGNQWVAYKSYYGLYGQHKALSKEQKESLFPEAFTPQKALEFLSSKNSKLREKDTRREARHKEIAADYGKQSSSTRSKPENEKEVEQSKASNQLIWLIVGVLSLGILALLLKVFKGKSTS
mgnify:CR=1 FL=1|jgi:hypothetical protein